jgi:hypothetical protein
MSLSESHGMHIFLSSSSDDPCNVSSTPGLSFTLPNNEGCVAWWEQGGQSPGVLLKMAGQSPGVVEGWG